MITIDQRQKLGEGAFSCVYKAEYQGKSFAIKVAKGDCGNEDIRREYRILRYLYRGNSQPSHISRIYTPVEMVILSKTIALSLHLCSETLYSRMERRGFSFPQIQQIITSLLEALCFIHERDIIHADVKLQNVFISPEGGVVLGDLGGAFFEGEAHEPDGCFLQTSFCRAPEAVVRSDVKGSSGVAITHLIDIWSLGLLILEVCLRRKIFPLEKVDWKDLPAQAKSFAVQGNKEGLLTLLSQNIQGAEGLIQRIQEQWAGVSMDPNLIEEEFKTETEYVHNAAMVYLHEYVLEKPYHEEFRSVLSPTALSVYAKKQVFPSPYLSLGNIAKISTLFSTAVQQGSLAVPLLEIQKLNSLVEYMVATRPWKRLSARQLQTHPFLRGGDLTTWEQQVVFPEKAHFCRRALHSSILRVDQLVQGVIDTAKITCEGEKPHIVKFSIKKEGKNLLINEDIMLRYLQGAGHIMGRGGVYWNPGAVPGEIRLLYEAFYTKSLQEHYASIRASLQEVRSFASQLGEALIVLAKAGIVHADIEPKHIFLSQGHVKLAGFARAFFEKEPQPVCTYTSSIYRAPESLQGRATKKGDIWSLGMVLAGASVSYDHLLGISSKILDSLECQELKDFLQVFLRDVPSDRINLEQILEHAFLTK
ncbi:MAG: hypothetical protein FJZ58_07325 [Chlamydiae bacterium]|nr:hypothetical protein [Chlamydiota bacterium]